MTFAHFFEFSFVEKGISERAKEYAKAKNKTYWAAVAKLNLKALLNDYVYTDSMLSDNAKDPNPPLITFIEETFHAHKRPKTLNLLHLRWKYNKKDQDFELPEEFTAIKPFVDWKTQEESNNLLLQSKILDTHTPLARVDVGKRGNYDIDDKIKRDLKKTSKAWKMAEPEAS
ncbi:unnamed protein product [Blepharisma stoltei]|uniref:Uncharacterized protein n=1 Tax=Blepharisma stoltei TaxID=1481888 RepID=A0AAU9K681_9CILI|nr:unnamed protein product [Blepharisma stoltei]